MELKVLINRLGIAYVNLRKSSLQAKIYGRHVETGEYSDLSDEEKKVHKKFQDKADVLLQEVRVLINQIVELQNPVLVTDSISNGSLLRLKALNPNLYLALKPSHNSVGESCFDVLIIDAHGQPR